MERTAKAVQGPLPAAVDLVVDERDDDQQDQAYCRVDDLGAGVGQGVALDVVAGGEIDHGHPVDDEGDGREQEREVEVTQVRADVHGQSVLVAPATRSPLRWKSAS
jgi:hypothetical protein